MVPGSEGTSDNVGMGSKSAVNGRGWAPRPLLPRASREPTISHQNPPSPAQFHLPKSSPTSILSSSPVFSSPLHKTETDRLMSSELGDQRFVKGGIVGGVGGVVPEPENVQCPRCESTNTKFCYYNNYNLSQPRYFCKACRRYWTRGGTLRNIPVGGGSRKNSKRSRPANSHPPPPQPPPQLHATPPAVSFGAPGDVNLNESLPPASFSSPLAPQSRLQQESPFLGLGGYGLGSGFDGLEFGPGDDGVVSTHHDQEPQSECNAWQVGETDGGDCFGWPELAMSTPGTARLEHSFWPAN